MITQIPNFINLLFGTIAIISIIWFTRASHSKTIGIGLVIWAILMSIIGLSGILKNSTLLPPPIFLTVFPTWIMIGWLFFSQKGTSLVNQFNLESLTYLSVIRVPVEITLALLYHQGFVSVWQTFEGANFDILSGITAPIVAYLFFTRKSISQKILLIWNIVCLLLLFTIIIISILSIPGPLQQISFDQPGLAILYFPFNLLPTLVVPIVLASHFIAINRLLKGNV